MQLRIQSQNALIGIDATSGYYSIQQYQWPMELKTEMPELKIKMKDAILLIDQRQCFADAGLKGIQEINRIYAAKGRRAALEGIARIAGEGKELADIHKGNALKAQAKRRTWRKTQQFGLVTMPKSRPEITVIPQEVTGNFQQGQVQIQTGKIKPDVEYTRGKLNVYLKQKQSIHIEFIGDRVDTYAG